MKKIIIIIAILFLAACSEEQPKTSDSVDDVVESVVAEETVSNETPEDDEVIEEVEEETQEDLYNSMQGVMSLEETEIVEGTGGQSHVFEVIIEGMVKFTSKNEGSSNFMVHVEDGITGDRIGSVANHIGDYEGSQFLNLTEGEYVLQVTSDGGWSIEIDQPFKDELITERTFSGSGSQTLGPFYFNSSRLEFLGAHNDDGNFMVHLLGVYGDRIDGLFNEIGIYEGNHISSIEQDFIYYIDITAGNEWSLEIKE